MLREKIIFTTVLLLLIFITGIVIYNNTNKIRIEEIGRFHITDVTKISFQYNNPAIKGGTIEDKERIKEFIDYISRCVFSKRHTQTPIAGYYQSATFFIGDKIAMTIMTYDDFIDINGTQYNMVKNKLSLDKIDYFIKSIK